MKWNPAAPTPDTWELDEAVVTPGSDISMRLRDDEGLTAEAKGTIVDEGATLTLIVSVRRVG